MKRSTPLPVVSPQSSGYESFDELRSPTYTFKYVIVGEVAVGKSCFLLQFIEQRFKNGHELTVGAEYGARLVYLNRKCIRLKIWDTAGSEQFRSIAHSYYRGATAALMFYDVTKRNSFNHLDRWLTDIRMLCPPNVVILLIGNKCDLDFERQVTYEEGLKFARENGLMFMEASAKISRNVEKAFIDLTNVVLATIEAADLSVIQNQRNNSIISVAKNRRKNSSSDNCKKCC